VAENKFDTEMQKYHAIACAREGISYAIPGEKHQPFLRWQIDCYPNFWDFDLNKEFKKSRKYCRYFVVENQQSIFLTQR
jgi:hypothetical protein